MPPPAARPTSATSLRSAVANITRPVIANERLSTNERGQVIYKFKQPFRHGTTHVVLDPPDFIARLAVRAAPAAEPHTISRGIRAQLQTSSACRAEPRCRRRENRQASRPLNLDTAPEARFCHGHRDLPRLRWQAARHRLHREPRRHRHNPRAHSSPRRGRTRTGSSRKRPPDAALTNKQFLPCNHLVSGGYSSYAHARRPVMGEPSQRRPSTESSLKAE